MKHLKILHLEDSSSDAELVLRVLKKTDFEFERLLICEKSQYLEAFKTFNPDIILCDHSLPSFNSYEALEILKESNVRIPFILITANVSEEFAVDVIQKGADDYILKDRLQRLPIAISNALEKYRFEKERLLFLEELKEREHRFRFLIENITDVISIINPDGLAKYYSPSIISVLGYSVEEMSGKNLLDLTYADDRRRISQVLEDATKLPEIAFPIGPVKLLHKDGTWRHIEGVLTNMVDEPAIKGFLHTFKDVTERETVLLKLRQNESRLLAAQKIASLGYWQVSLPENLLYWSDEVFNIWGVNKNSEELTFNAFFERIHPDDRKSFDCHHADFVAGLADFDMEYRLLLKDGTLKWVHDKGDLIRNEKGVPVMLEGTVQDITTQRKTLEKLGLSEARHRGIVNSQTNYIIRTDLEGRYSYYNDKFFRDFGWIYPDGEALGMDSMSSIMPYHHGRVIDAVTKCLQTPNKVFQAEIDKPKPDGGIRTTLWDFVCLLDVESVPNEIQCAGIDISDRIAAEEALMKSLQRYDYVTQATFDAIWDWDLKSDSIYWGKGLDVVFGHPINDITSTSNFWNSQIHKEDVSTILSSIQSALTDKNTNWEQEYRFRKHNGEYAYVRHRGLVINDEKGIPLRMVGAIADISDQKQGELQLLELNEQLRNSTSELILSNNELQQFSYIVSHNLRSPVANILGLTDLIGSEDVTENERAPLIEELLTSGQRLDTVIKDLNKILQIKGKMNEHDEQLTLSEILDDIKEDFQEEISSVQAELVFDLSRANQLMSIRSYLSSIFYNLISNSIKYAQPGIAPRIEITSKLKKGFMIINYTDNGLGINLANKEEQIFGLYKRFHTHVSGKGMGLFIVKTQVTALGGKIAVASEVGVGTTFTIELPLTV
ncbi:MAG TPA: PAS domain-containing protein [Pedobacter sp.]|jgi:PAS domain S-box-containing protein